MCVCVCDSSALLFFFKLLRRSFSERRQVADGHELSLTISGLTRFYLRPVPALWLLVLGFGRCVSSTCVCVIVRLRAIYILQCPQCDT